MFPAIRNHDYKIPKPDSNQIRVLRIITRMNIGGPAYQITNLMQGLDKSNFHQLLLAGNCDESESDFLIANNIDVAELRVKRLVRSISLFNDLLAVVEIVKIIRDYKPDIIHTHTFKAGLLGRVASLFSLKRFKRVHTFHGHLLKGYYGFLGTFVIRLVESLLARITNNLVAVGIRVRDELLGHRIGNLLKYEVIYPGINIEASTKETCVDLPESKTIFTWLGRFVEVKMPQRIIEVARLSKLRRIPAHFVLAGDGPLRETIEKIATEEKLPISFLGWVEDPAALISQSDVIFLTSANEGTPISLIQGQLLGKPIIATNVGSVSEIVSNGNSGLIIEFSSKEFVDCVSFFCEPLNREKFGKYGKEFCQLNFGIHSFLDKHQKLYNSLVNRQH